MPTTQDEFINKLKTNLEDKFESGEIGNKEITPVEGVHFNPDFSPPQTTITGDDLKPVSEIKLPDKPVDETNFKGIIDGGQAEIDALNQANPQDTTGTPSSNLDDLFSQYLSGSQAPPNLGNMFETASAEAGIEGKTAAVTQAQKDLDLLNAQATGLTAEAKAVPIQLQEESIGRGRTSGGIAPLEASRLRKIALKSLPLQAEILAKQAILTGNQNTLLAAQNKLNQVFQIRQTDATNQYNYQKELRTSVFDFATAKEQAKIADLQRKEDKDFELLTLDIQNANNLASTAMANGQADIAGQISALDPKSPTFKQDIATLQAQIVPEGYEYVATPAERDRLESLGYKKIERNGKTYMKKGEDTSTATTTRMINGEEHNILYNTQTGEDIKDLGISKPAENSEFTKIGVDENGEDIFGFVNTETNEVTSFIDKAGMRTDRHNNPIAVAMPTGGTNEFTDALDNAGIEWTQGDPFPNNPNMATIDIKGNPIEASRVILSDTGALQNWYINHTGKTVLSDTGITNNEEFKNAPLEIQDKIISGIYKAEGGNGSLLKSLEIQDAGIDINDPLSQFSPDAIDLAKSVASGDAKWSDITGTDNAQLKIEAIRAAKLLPPPEKEVKRAGKFVEDLETLLTHKGLNSSVGAFDVTRRSYGDAFGAKKDFIALANQLVSQKALDALIEAKSQGATFGALSDTEMAILKSAATTLGTWEIKGYFGIGDKPRGYDIDEKSFKREIQKMIDGYKEILAEAEPDPMGLL